ncbi:hypothetical protein BJA01nite_36780 [Bradyrhizobium japonicum]|nr:hypothetical protein BJ6T_20750 [Bradyrhizobium japonicum USDA 6]GEC46036.1 hypothetical protein BJA01nite_36780 [Bradyrhizobium japonicum]
MRSANHRFRAGQRPDQHRDAGIAIEKTVVAAVIPKKHEAFAEKLDRFDRTTAVQFVEESRGLPIHS